MLLIPLEIAKKLKKYDLDHEPSSFVWVHPWQQHAFKERKNRWIILSSDNFVGLRITYKAYSLDELLGVLLRFYAEAGDDGLGYMQYRYTLMLEKFVYEGSESAFDYLESLIKERQKAWLIWKRKIIKGD